MRAQYSKTDQTRAIVGHLLGFCLAAFETPVQEIHDHIPLLW